MRSLAKMACGLLLVVGVAVAPATAAQASPSEIAVVALSAPVTTASYPGGWVEWDGFHITTQQKCYNRLNYIAQQYQISPGQLMCWRVDPPCGVVGEPYWVVLYYGGAFAAYGGKDEALSAAPAGALC